VDRGRVPYRADDYLSGVAHRDDWLRFDLHLYRGVRSRARHDEAEAAAELEA
jgi:hypothetical protein